MTKKRTQKYFLNIWRHHKIALISIVLVTIIASMIFTYMQDDIYESQCSIDVGHNKLMSSSSDLMDSVIHKNETDIFTKIALFTSESLLYQVLNEVDLSHHMYLKGWLKNGALYDKSPFQVKLSKGKDIWFILKPLKDKKHYILSFKNTKILESEEEILCTYGKSVKTEKFELTITLANESYLDTAARYQFINLSRQHTVTALRKHISVSQVDTHSTLLNVKCKDKNPKKSMHICNALLDVYLLEDIKNRTQEASQTLAFIDEQLLGMNKNMKDTQKDISKITEKTTLFTPQAKHSVLMSKMDKYSESLERIPRAIEQLSVMQKNIKNNKPYVLPSMSVDTSQIAKVMDRLQEGYYRRKKLRKDYTALHPAVKAVTKEIVHYKNRLSKSIALLIDRLGNRQEELKDKILKIKNSLKQLPQKEKLYQDLEKQFVVNEKTYAYFLQKRATTAIVKASMVNSSKIINPPTYPAESIAPNRLLILVIGLIGGIVLGWVFVILKEYFSDSIKNEAYLREYTHLPILGLIPQMKNSYQNILALDAPKSVISESFRALRSNLQFYTKKDKGMIISVTSTVGGEGKSTISSNLAGIISLIDKKIVIVNMDMRKPTLHTIFNVSNQVGMSTILSGHKTLSDVIKHTEYKNIDVITSGIVPPNPSELIENDAMRDMLLQLTEMYDMIILDTPPIGLVTDALRVMEMSDIVLYVLREGYTKRAALDDVEQLNHLKSIKKVGLILNGIKSHKHGYGYYEEA